MHLLPLLLQSERLFVQEVMARGNGVGVKGNKRRKIKEREEESEESDEEYNVGEDEDSDESDEWYSLDGDESEEILLDDLKKSKRVSRSRNTRTTCRKGNEVTKPRKRTRVYYTDDDGDDDDDEFMCLGKKGNRINKCRENKRVSCTEDDEEFVSSIRNQRKKRQEKKVSYTVTEDDDDDDDDGFMSSGKKKNQRKKRVLYTEDDEEFIMSLGKEGKEVNKDRDSFTEEDVDVDVDDAEFVSSGRNQRNKEKNRVSDTEEDDHDHGDDEEDYAEFVSMGRKRRQRNWVSDTEEDDKDEEFNEMKNTKEKKRVSYTKEEEEEEDDDDEYYDGFVSLSRKKAQEKTEEDNDDEFMYLDEKVNQKKNLREKRKISYTEDDEFKKSNSIIDLEKKRNVSSEDENDAEFKLSESDFLDDDEDEDETPKMKKTEKSTKSHPMKKRHKKPSRTRTKQRKVASCKIRDKKSKKVTPESDSDFVSASSSDHEYTISEEEREQMREARVYCANLRDKLRCSSSQQRKYPIRKGKEKLQDTNTKDEIGKQVCGICLSEEAKRTVRGFLNCCRHYFCFSCIMEWSKVESRCPLCKQRFSTITKAAKSNTGFDSRTVVIPVPECDQVYQPSEEELRGYLDPYESVICTECQHGGEDALMLLCDICDSSAHTFCVGLGREVPEGNWYCGGCRPTVFGSVNSSDLPSPGFDLNELYVPETPLTQQQQQQPEHGEFMPATTLRDRRRIHRQIHHRFLNNNRMNEFVNRNGSSSSSSSGIRLFGSQLDQPQRDDHVLPSMEQLGCADVALELEGGHGGPSMGFGQLHPCTNRSTIGSDARLSPSPYATACREVVGPSQGGFHAPY